MKNKNEYEYIYDTTTDIKYKDFWEILKIIARKIHRFDQWLFSHVNTTQPKIPIENQYVVHHVIHEKTQQSKKEYYQQIYESMLKGF
jgi:hypothetical protein